MIEKLANKKIVKSVYKKVKEVKSVLLFNPRELFDKERELTNKPFFFQGTNNEAVILVHGWTSVPYEVRRLGKYLNENGYTASGPMLRGHGTVPSDLRNVEWKDWVLDIENEYEKLKKTHKKVFVAGTSIGSSVAIMLAQKNPEIAGLILMAAPFRIKFERITVFFGKLMGLFKEYNKKYYPPMFGSRRTITRIISYQTYPIKSAVEAFELVKEARKFIRNITQPVFVIQSLSDHVVSKGSLVEIYNQVGSEVKRKKYIKRAYHTFISDIKNEEVFEDILNFIKEN